MREELTDLLAEFRMVGFEMLLSQRRLDAILMRIERLTGVREEEVLYEDPEA